MLEDTLILFNEVALYTILEETESTFTIEDVQEEDHIFTVTKEEWYRKIQTWLIEDTMMDRWVMDGLDYHDVLKICLRVAALEDAVKEIEKNGRL